MRRGTLAKRALVTGITGQDGAYLASFCWKKATPFTASNGVPPPSIPIASITFTKDPHEKDVRLKLHYGDLTDSTNLSASFRRCSLTKFITWLRRAT